jgi:hypothetical protein
MKHLRKRIFLLLVIVAALIGLLKIIALSLGLPLSGRYDSPSIKVSKENTAFVEEYIPISNPLKINDTLKIRVKEAWIEQECYFDGKNDRVIVTGPGYKLLVTLEDDLPNSVVFKGFSGENGIPIVGHYPAPPRDTIDCNIENYDHVVLGKFVLIRKDS